MDKCGYVEIGGSGIEWICVRSVHAKVYKRRTSSRNSRKGKRVYEDNPGVYQHYFQPRRPNQP